RGGALEGGRGMRVERARTLLAFGRRLHRARRRAEARDRLREALDGFERLGAEAWAGQAGAELRAAGARRRRESGGPDGDALTAQEWRGAGGVRRGAAQPAIAGALFLSPETGGFPLPHNYRQPGAHAPRPPTPAPPARPPAEG